MDREQLRLFLDKKVESYNKPEFVWNDPVCIPKMFNKKEDQEIAGFFAAMFAWGNRTTIINKSKELMQLMDMQPWAFCMQAGRDELTRLLEFKHRTFNPTDLLYFVDFFRHHYTQHDSLETAFTMHGDRVVDMLSGFHRYFFSLEDAPARTRKHIATPERGSTCKRLNMFLRWMVRADDNGVDLGIWKIISPASLIIPVDIHVARVARQFGLLHRKQTDWIAAEQLTAQLSQFDPLDPVKYDFALFALGVNEKFG